MGRRRQALAYLIAASPQAVGHQRAAVRKYAKAEKIEIVSEFTDDSTVQNRHGLGAVTMAIRDQKITLVLIGAVRHLGESVVQQHSVIGLLKLRGASVVDCSTGECVSEDGSAEATMIHETVAEVEELRRQTLAGRLIEARKSGAKGGQKPYGFYPQEAAVVDLIMQLRREQGLGVRRIANELNRRGIVNRAGGPWQASAIQRVFNRHE